jgi:hypothetical protein
VVGWGEEGSEEERRGEERRGEERLLGRGCWGGVRLACQQLLEVVRRMEVVWRMGTDRTGR